MDVGENEKKTEAAGPLLTEADCQDTKIRGPAEA
jgi:hypothetical protein